MFFELHVDLLAETVVRL